MSRRPTLADLAGLVEEKHADLLAVRGERDSALGALAMVDLHWRRPNCGCDSARDCVRKIAQALDSIATLIGERPGTQHDPQEEA